MLWQKTCKQWLLFGSGFKLGIEVTGATHANVTCSINIKYCKTHFLQPLKVGLTFFGIKYQICTAIMGKTILYVFTPTLYKLGNSFGIGVFIAF